MSEYSKECFKQFILDNAETGSNIRREHGHYKLVCKIDGYTFKIKWPEHYEAPHAKKIYNNFRQYMYKKFGQNKQEKVLEIIEEYTHLMNSFTSGLIFDSIVFNIFNYEPRRNPLKRGKQ